MLARWMGVGSIISLAGQITFLGSTYANLEFSPDAVLLTSGTKQPQIEEGVLGYAKATHKHTGRFPYKRFFMSDAAEEYRATARTVFSQKEVPCETQQ